MCPGGEMRGGSQGRKSELEVNKSNILPPHSHLQKFPRTLRDIGRDLGFLPFMDRGLSRILLYLRSWEDFRRLEDPVKYMGDGVGKLRENCSEGYTASKNYLRF